MRKLGDDQQVHEYSFQEALALHKILEFLEINGFVSFLDFKSGDESLDLVVRVDAGNLDMVKDLRIKEVTTMFLVQNCENSSYVSIRDSRFSLIWRYKRII